MTKAKIYLCLNYLTFPHNSCIKNETRVREAGGIFKIEVPDNVRKIVIVKAQVHGVMTYITPLFLQFFVIHFSTLFWYQIIINLLFLSLYIDYLPICAILLSSYFYDLVYTII
jgi:hypothetical protein